jgi:hypothetical protein
MLTDRQLTKTLIYVAGPYTHGEPVLNLRRALGVANAIHDLGGIAYVPHLCHLWHFHSPKHYDFWIEHGLEMLVRCDALYRFDPDKKSEGAELEWTSAEQMGIPTFNEWFSFKTWLQKRER